MLVLLGCGCPTPAQPRASRPAAQQAGSGEELPELPEADFRLEEPGALEGEVPAVIFVDVDGGVTGGEGRRTNQ